MADRRVRWTPADKEVFTRAWNYLDSKTPEIERDVVEFSKGNISRWDVSYKAEPFRWGRLTGKVPSRETSRDDFGAPKYWSLDEALKMHGITADDLHELATFAASIGTKYNLNVKRVLAGNSVELDLRMHPEVAYGVKPKFDEFRQV